jgi:GT2 family glycosyltransferase
MKSVCLAILNYNGIGHLQYLLPSVCEAAEDYSGDCSVLVLDNRSTQPDIEWVKKKFPSVKVVLAPKNDYFFSYNWLLPGLSEDIVVLLNNDMRVKKDFLLPLVKHLESLDVFAASACSYDWDGTRITTGPVELVFKDGFYGWPFNLSRQETAHTLFCSGACMAVDRKKFLELGGFNQLFYPAYCEDLEICFRAWRRGWRCVYEPSSVVWHREQASWSASPVSRSDQLNLKNSLLFQWSSLPMGRGRVKRYWSITKILTGFFITANFVWLKILVKSSSIWLKNRRQYRNMKISPAELEMILSRMRSPF